MFDVRYDDFSCRFFPYTLEGKATTWYHSLPIAAIHTWKEFKKLFFEMFANDKTPTTLLKEFRSIKMGERDKVKDLNKKLNLILNKLRPGMQSHNWVTIYYYTASFPTNISQFLKRVVNVMLALNFVEAIITEKDLRMIGFIMNDDESKDSK